MLQLKRYGLVAHGADQYPVGGVSLWSEHVVAHHTLATHWNPQICSLRSAQGSPSKIELTGIIHLKNRGANGPASLSPEERGYRRSRIECKINWVDVRQRSTIHFTDQVGLPDKHPSLDTSQPVDTGRLNQFAACVLRLPIPP